LTHVKPASSLPPSDANDNRYYIHYHFINRSRLMDAVVTDGKSNGAGQVGEQCPEVVKNIADISPASGFFFTSPFRSLATQGCFTQLTLPAAGGEALNGEFQQAIAQAFIQARNAGIAHPIVCGAIPFDTQQPSALFVPKEVQWFDRQQFLDNAPVSQNALPQVKRKNGTSRAN
jgi:isochorismate synthase